ncbi:MAG: hypothetical protein M5R36_13190 [Deltaproteobacteria bacterium]|nr:hypothetical protein [Deltaproteobacteria bacterium]
MPFGNKQDARVSADRQKRGMPQGNLSRVAHEKIEADRNDDGDGDVVDVVDLVSAQHKRSAGQRQKKNDRPDPVPQRREKTHIFVMRQLHVHAGRSPDAWSAREAQIPDNGERAVS